MQAKAILLPELPPLADIIAGFDMVSVIGVYGRAGRWPRDGRTVRQPRSHQSDVAE
jgi:hypothetical protein